MTAKFVAEEGEITGLELALAEGDEWFLGRDPDECSLVIEDSTVSRKHLLCRQTPQGYSIENLNSDNPIFVNNEEVDEPMILNSGDTVKVGNVVLRFNLETEGAPVEEAPKEEEEVATAVEEPPAAPAKEEEIEEHVEHDTILKDASLIEDEDTLVAEVNFDLTEGSRWVLKVISGPNSGAEFPLEPNGGYLIGTDANSCDVVLHDISVSHHHAKLNLDNNGTLSVEDLESRNGVFVDGEAIDEKVPNYIHTHQVVSLGTSAFIVFDREEEAKTIVSPLIPRTGKLWEKAPELALTDEGEEQKASSAVGSLIILGIVTALIVVITGGIFSLFQSEEIQVVQLDQDSAVMEVVKQYPSVQYRYDQSNKSLLLMGHLLTDLERSELAFGIKKLPFNVRVIDRIIIDDRIIQENNNVISKNPQWQSVKLQASEPGQFVLTGFLDTRQQAEALNTFLNINFLYVDTLKNQVVVEENILNSVDSRLQDLELNAVTVEFEDGNLTLAGNVAFEQGAVLEDLVKEFQQINGVRNVRNFVVESSPQDAMVNLTGQYEVTGYSSRGGANVSVVINGKILSRGDRIDGLTIVSIRPNVVFLERDNVKYRIDYNN